MNSKLVQIFLVAFALGILVGSFGPSVVKIVNNPITEKPRLMKTVIELTKLHNSLESYKENCGRYPSSLANLPDGLEHNPSCETNEQPTNFKADRWGNSYIYKHTDVSFQVISCGNSWIEVNSGEGPKSVEEPE